MDVQRTGDERVLTPTTWLNSAHVERWLSRIWLGWRYDDVRHEWDEEGRWYWIIPDFERGRSRIVGVDPGLLEEVTVAQLRRVLEDANWMSRIDAESLLVRRDSSGGLRVERWSPEIDEAWFPDPRGGYYVAYPSRRGLVSSARVGPFPEDFLALHGATWSARGPSDPRRAETYTEEDLRLYLPGGVARGS